MIPGGPLPSPDPPPPSDPTPWDGLSPWVLGAGVRALGSLVALPAVLAVALGISSALRLASGVLPEWLFRDRRQLFTWPTDYALAFLGASLLLLGAGVALHRRPGLRRALGFGVAAGAALLALLGGVCTWGALQ